MAWVRVLPPAATTLTLDLRFTDPPVAYLVGVSLIQRIFPQVNYKHFTGYHLGFQHTVLA